MDLINNWKIIDNVISLLTALIVNMKNFYKAYFRIGFGWFGWIGTFFRMGKLGMDWK